jgi:hypothetical protein
MAREMNDGGLVPRLLSALGKMDRTSSRARRHRSHRRRYWLYWNALFCALIATTFIACTIVVHRGALRRHLTQSMLDSSVRHIGPGQSISSEISPVFDVQKRRLYPYSVIPGGLRSASDLRSAIAHDPLVALHYANFDVTRAQIVQLDRDEAVHISFRLNNQIYWTKKTLVLHRGESVITDGEHEARTRCGNRISVALQTPVSPKEPSAEAMEAALKFPLAADVPEIWPSPNPVMPPLFENFPSPSGELIPPAYFPIVGGGGPNSPPVPTQTVATPEPSAFLLLALGLLTLVSRSWVVHLTNRLSRT